jgi:tetratricopeptide (TPR) repeat protein
MLSGDSPTHATLVTLKARAEELAKNGDFGPEALEVNGQLVAGNPRDLAARSRLARCCAAAGQFDEAEAEYLEILRQDPHHTIATNWLPRIRLQKRLGGADPEEFMRQSPPRAFSGFAEREFVELGLCTRESFENRFGARLLDFVDKVNALPAAQRIIDTERTGFRRLYRRGTADVHWQSGHWYIFHLGGRWTPQFNIGMYSDLHHPISCMRIGLGFNSSLQGRDPNPLEGQAKVRALLARFQEQLRGDDACRRLFTSWMTQEQGVVECDLLPTVDPQMNADAAADWIQAQSVTETKWLFFGKWLRVDAREDRQVLADRQRLLRTIDQVFAGLRLIWLRIIG